MDLESQQLILEMLAGSMREFSLGLLAEESEDNASRFETDAFWCIDPLDGTLPFVEGTAGYSISIALVSRGGEPLIGVVRDPVDKVTYHACRQGGAFRNALPMSSVAPRDDGKSLTWLMDRSMKSVDQFSFIETALRQLAVRKRMRSWDTDGRSRGGCAERLLGDRAGAGRLFQAAEVGKGRGIALGLCRIGLLDVGERRTRDGYSRGTSRSEPETQHIHEREGSPLRIQ